jgi:SAM-dependent methyltransferase
MFATLRHQLHLLTYSWRALGPRTLLRDTLRYWRDREARNHDASFDARFGTDTTTEVTPAEGDLPADRRPGATMYMPSHDGDLDRMLTALGWSEADLRAATFLDIGSGKARVVFLAAMRRFREVVGLELSPVLHAIAERNLELMRASGVLTAPVRLERGDAAALAVPDTPFIAYLYHPFREPVAELVMARIRTSLEQAPRPAAIFYGHPTLQRPLDPAVFGRDHVFEPLAHGERRTRRFRIGWTVWTNQAWLGADTAATAVSA